MQTNRDRVKSIYILFKDRLSRLVMNMVPPKDVEDIVQEAYVRVCQVENDREIRHPRSFLYATARNLALDHIKKSETRLVSSLEDEEIEEWDCADVEFDETFSRVVANREFSDFCEAVRQLPQQCRKVFVLKKVYGYSQKEISESMGISESTVEKHIAKGIKRCRQYMLSLDVPEDANIVRKEGTR